MRLTEETKMQVKHIITAMYDNSEIVCKKFDAFEAYQFYINDASVRFTTIQQDGSHWVRVIPWDEFLEMMGW